MSDEELDKIFLLTEEELYNLIKDANPEYYYVSVVAQQLLRVSPSKRSLFLLMKTRSYLGEWQPEAWEAFITAGHTLTRQEIVEDILPQARMLGVTEDEIWAHLEPGE